MAKKNINWGKIALYTGIIGTVGIGVYYLIKALKPDEDYDFEELSGETATSSCEPIDPLRKGSGIGARSCEARYVKVVQKALNEMNYKIPVDGQWGDETEDALSKAFARPKPITITKVEYNNIRLYGEPVKP